MSMILDGTNGATFNDGSLQAAAASPFVLKNRIINGDMRIDQRNAGASLTITANPQYTLDRWFAGVSLSSKISVQQSSTVPTGFTNSMLVTSLAATTPGTNDVYYIAQSIEGYNVADLDFGKATAKTITISFWVRSSLTGTFGAVLLNASSNRSFPFNYTISTANTWTQITQTIAGDTTGTWLTDNSTGFQLRFGLGAGSTYQGVAGSWGTTNAVTTTTATTIVATNGATWYVTGVQLEIGSTATPFERRLYNQELANCQRYFQKSYAQGTAVGTNTATGCATIREYGTSVYLPNFQRSLIVTMRGSPTITWYTTGGTAGSVTVGGGTNTINTQYDISDTSTGWMFINGSVASNSQIYAQFTASAEL